MRKHLFIILAVAAIPLSSLAQPAGVFPNGRAPSAGRTTKSSLEVSSDAFARNEAIPSEYTCDGAQTTPPLTWSKAPPTTRSIAIMMENPDASGGALMQWLVTGIEPKSMFMPPDMLPPGAAVSKNEQGEMGYAAPCATQRGHRYVFHVYALDTTLPAAISKDVFLGSIQGHILAEGALLGTYGGADLALRR
jgi:Raf kinase inhibitor-like YbhB/YbcL family protein